jgi:hypothetical protein
MWPVQIKRPGSDIRKKGIVLFIPPTEQGQSRCPPDAYPSSRPSPRANSFERFVVLGSSKTRTVIPVHSGKTIKEPLLRAILRGAELATDEFIQLL